MASLKKSTTYIIPNILPKIGIYVWSSLIISSQHFILRDLAIAMSEEKINKIQIDSNGIS